MRQNIYKNKSVWAREQRQNSLVGTTLLRRDKTEQMQPDRLAYPIEQSNTVYTDQLVHHPSLRQDHFMTIDFLIFLESIRLSRREPEVIRRQDHSFFGVYTPFPRREP